MESKPPIDSSLFCFSCGLPLIEPRQAECGDRLCKICCDSFSARYKMAYVHNNMVVFIFPVTCTFRDKKKVVCSKCGTEVLLEDLFRDKAVERDLKRLEFPCIYKQCTWTGINLEYRVIHCNFKLSKENLYNCISFRNTLLHVSMHQ